MQQSIVTDMATLMKTHPLQEYSCKWNLLSVTAGLRTTTLAVMMTAFQGSAVQCLMPLKFTFSCH